MPDNLIQPIVCSKELEPLLHEIEEATELCLDTEADSMYHYFEKICLLQFTIPSNGSKEASHFLIDPLADLDLAPLFNSLKSKRLILHGADYDLRILRNDFEFVPVEIFDTMLAARLAGHTALGLDRLVERYTGVTLDHGAQKADWSQRPLPERLLKYAVNDTRHLPLIVQTLREELENLGRTEWHRQQCEQLIRLSSNGSKNHNKDSNESWRIKGSFELDSQKLAILREVWKWRDTEARGWDRPPFMVLTNDKLLELTHWAAQNRGENISGNFPLPKRWSPRRLESLKAALKQAWESPPTSWPLPAPRGKRPAYDPVFVKRLQRLRTSRDIHAKAINLDPSILAPNAMLESIASHNPKKLEEFSIIERWLPWQTDFLGKTFLEALNEE